MKKLSVVISDLFLSHSNPPGHPECRERLSAILQTLQSSGLLEKTVSADTQPATEEQIVLVHSKSYFDMVKSTSDNRAF